MKRIVNIFLRLMMLDSLYWSKIYPYFAWRIRYLYNRIFDYLYIGENLGGIVYSERLKKHGAYQTQSVDYIALYHGIKKIRITESDVIVDAGCGKGRAIVWFLKHYKQNRVFGIELNEEIADQTTKRFEKYPNVTIIKGDAIENIPLDGSIFYMYNPFVGSVMQRFKEKLEELYYLKKSIILVYHNPIYCNVFYNDPKWSIEYFKIKPVLLAKLLRFRQQDTAIIKLNS